ncbi:hypothetical protein HNQ50_003848 [Silvimonas terrae]|uniref:LTD domain-containing protein n=1 Tax=Silvimonas terrae TaxID=300266 RepID=A0A840RKI8_9NEIS|nr:hypothetical protein [Silvimonas terrae]MBB5193094.1 hypothetical protein [Silvimonas terrae]
MKYASQTQALVVSATAALILAACGGGGGDSSSGASSTSSNDVQVAPSLVPQTSQIDSTKPVGVFISEVANHHYSYTAAWLEIVNNSGKAIDLGNYGIRALVQNPVTGVGAGSETISLPHVTLAQGGRIVVAGKVSNGLLNSSHAIYIADATGNVPSWDSANGFVELVSNNQTVDFVHFGTDNTTPLTSGAWVGAPVPAMNSITTITTPFTGPYAMNASIVRLESAFKQTHSAADWTYVNFATPGGPNDVPAGVTDSDNDGIPDSAKISGNTFNGINLYSMGARPGQRDLFVQVDYMDHSTHNDAGIILQKRALDNVVAAFLPHNIYLHFDAGNLFSSGFNTSAYNLSGTVSNLHPFVSCVDVNPTTPGVETDAGCSDIYTIKAATFDYRRASIFRYMLLGYSQTNPARFGGSSGVAEILGPNFLVTLGNWNLSTGTAADLNSVVNYQAATIMHEMGHTLGLLHGGNENTNYKPNHLSVMNYMYQLNGVPDSSGAIPAGHTMSEINERYYYYQWDLQQAPSTAIVPGIANNDFMPDNMSNGPATTTFNLDYSNGTSAAMSESALIEGNVVGRTIAAGAFGDWDLSGALTTAPESVHIVDGGADSSYDTNMTDYNDWNNLTLSFARYPLSHYAGISLRSASTSSTQTAPYDPVLNTRMPVLAEEPLSAAVRARLQRH